LLSCFTQFGGWLFFVVGCTLFFKNNLFESLPKKGWLFGSFVVINLFYLMLSTNSTPNPHDDLQKYFLHPWSLINRGTFFYNPMSVIGYETLGGIGFLHSLYWGMVETKNLLYVDFYLGITLIAIYICSQWRNQSGYLSLLLVVFVLLSPTQVVNSTPVYLAIVTICAILYCMISSPLAIAKNAIPVLAMLIYSLFLYKTLYFLYIISLVFLCLLLLRPFKTYLFKLSLVGLFVFALCLPWLPLGIDMAFSRNPLPKIPAGLTTSQVPQLSFDTLFYGGTTAYFALLLLFSFFVMGLAYSKKNRKLLIAPLSVLLAFGAYVFSPLMTYLPIDHALRYILPPLIGLFIFSLTVALPLNVVKSGGIVTMLILVYLSSSPLYSLKVIFGYQTLRVDGPRFNDAYGQSYAFLHKPKYAEEVNQILELIPDGSKVGVYIQNASIISDSRLVFFAYEFTANPGFYAKFDSLDYFLWEVHPDARMSPRKIAYSSKQPDWLSRRFAQGLEDVLLHFKGKPPIYKSKRFALYQIQ
jgi:hypothetical protein